MKNKKSSVIEIITVIVIILIILLVVISPLLLVLLITTPSDEKQKLCKEICMRKGYDYVGALPSMCKCLDKYGDIIQVRAY